MMKKLICVLLAACLSLGFLVSCDGDGGGFVKRRTGYWGIKSNGSLLGGNGDYDYEYYGDYDDYSDYSDRYGDYDDHGDYGDHSGNTDDDDDENYGDYGDHSGQSGNNGNSGQSGGTQYTEDYKFEHSLYDCAPGEISISANYSSFTDPNEDVVVAPTYTDYTSETYRIVKDYKTGFGGLSAKTITLSEGFREIEVGFSGCPNLKIIYLPSTITKLGGYIITNCPRLDKIVFNGTKAQWNTIDKDDHWNYLAQSIGIDCTDGYIELQSWAESH